MPFVPSSPRVFHGRWSLTSRCVLSTDIGIGRDSRTMPSAIMPSVILVSSDVFTLKPTNLLFLGVAVGPRDERTIDSIFVHASWWPSNISYCLSLNPYGAPGRVGANRAWYVFVLIKNLSASLTLAAAIMPGRTVSPVYRMIESLSAAHPTHQPGARNPCMRQ